MVSPLTTMFLYAAYLLFCSYSLTWFTHSFFVKIVNMLNTLFYNNLNEMRLSISTILLNPKVWHNVFIMAANVCVCSGEGGYLQSHSQMIRSFVITDSGLCKT